MVASSARAIKASFMIFLLNRPDNPDEADFYAVRCAGLLAMWSGVVQSPVWKLIRAMGSRMEERMLAFDDGFHPDGVFGCVLWADETVKKRRVRFYIGPNILEDVLHGGN